MNIDALPEGWDILRGWLPADLDRRARKHGFSQRARGLQDAERWLRLILMHVAGGLSLEQTSVRARELGLAQICGVALGPDGLSAQRAAATLGAVYLALPVPIAGH